MLPVCAVVNDDNATNVTLLWDHNADMSLAGAFLLIRDDWNATENSASKYYADRCA